MTDPALSGKVELVGLRSLRFSVIWYVVRRNNIKFSFKSHNEQEISFNRFDDISVGNKAIMSPMKQIRIKSFCVF